MKYNPDAHHRRSIRLHHYDYTQAGAYFITICTHERLCILGRIEGRTAVLSEYGAIVKDSWLRLNESFLNIDRDVFVVMPNHLHGIVIISRGTDMIKSRQGEAFDTSPRTTAQFRASNASPLKVRHTQRPTGTQAGSLGAVIQNFKSVSARKVNQVRGTPGLPVWQRNYYEHVIRSEGELNVVRQYILDNPAKWEEDVENPRNL